MRIRSTPILVALSLALVACGSPSGSIHGTVVSIPDASPGDTSATKVMTLGEAGVTRDADGTGDASNAFDAPAAPVGSDALGATVVQGGVTFRVWAPSATAARVTGDFGAAPVPMAAGADGTFSTTVASAHAGSSYHFEFDSSAGTVLRNDPYCRQVSGEDCLVVDPSAYAWSSGSFTRPPKNGTVVYELHVGAFGAGPSDAVDDGTFATAAAKLPRLAALGVNVVELMPVNDHPGAGNWGYDPDLWLTPTSYYGTADQLRAFVDAAHALGIGVWIDFVVNHYDGGGSGPLLCFDGPCTGSAAGIYFFPDGPYATTPWGPRPDYSKPQVTAMLEAAVSQWFEEFHGDGVRWDSTSNIRAVDGSGTVPGGQAFLVAANALIHAAGGTSVAEDLKGYAAITASSGSGGGFDFDAQWDGFGYDVPSILTQTSDASRDLGVLQGDLTGGYNGDGFQRLLFTEDHDTVGNGGARLPNRIDPTTPTSIFARQRSVLGAVLLLTTPGVPMLFMGQESLATGTFTDPPAPLAAETQQGALIRAFYTDMIRLRRNLDGGSGGLSDANIEVFHRNDTAKVVAYRRFGASGEDVVVLMNLSNTAFTEYDIGMESAGPFRIRMDTASTAYGTDLPTGPSGLVTAAAGSRDGKPFTLAVALPPYSALVFTR